MAPCPDSSLLLLAAPCHHHVWLLAAHPLTHDFPITAGGKVQGLELPKRVFPCATPAEVRATLPSGDVLAFQCRNPIHKAHYELFIRALEADNVGEGAVCLVHPTCGPTQVCCEWSICPAACQHGRQVLMRAGVHPA